MAPTGMLLFVTGDLDGGIGLVGHSRRIHERLQDREGGGVALSFLAQMSFAKGDYDRAMALYREALEDLETVGDQLAVARVQCEMGWAALGTGGEAAVLAMVGE